MGASIAAAGLRCVAQLLEHQGQVVERRREVGVSRPQGILLQGENLAQQGRRIAGTARRRRLGGRGGEGGHGCRIGHGARVASGGGSTSPGAIIRLGMAIGVT
jgi:hypothetical protein